MSAPALHECPDGATYRLTVIQTVRDDPLFDGERFSFRVEEEGTENGDAFTVNVEYAPIFVINASPQDRLLLDTWAEQMVTRLLDSGVRQSTDLRVTSDGAVKMGDELLDRLQRLSKSA